jgi:hypothetical protein
MKRKTGWREAVEGARVRGCEGARVRGYEGARVRGCEGTRVRGCEGARVRGYLLSELRLLGCVSAQQLALLVFML